MRHLVLGGCGQIGTHLIERLLSNGHEAHAMDLSLGHAHDLRRRGNRLLNAEMEWCDIVHFLAFDAGGAAYLEEHQHTVSFISNNVKIMDAVFDVLERTEKPFFFASSQMANMAFSTYGRLKAIGEAYTRAIGGVIVQYWNIYGWEPDADRSHCITDFIRMARDRGSIAMRTDGKEERQFLYADDCADCLLELSLRYGAIPRDRPVHVSSFEWTSIGEIAALVSGMFGNCPITASPRTDDVQRGLRNEPDRYVLEFWRPVTPLANGIRAGGGTDGPEFGAAAGRSPGRPPGLMAAARSEEGGSGAFHAEQRPAGAHARPGNPGADQEQRDQHGDRRAAEAGFGRRAFDAAGGDVQEGHGDHHRQRVLDQEVAELRVAHRGADVLERRADHGAQRHVQQEPDQELQGQQVGRRLQQPGVGRPPRRAPGPAGPGAREQQQQQRQQRPAQPGMDEQHDRVHADTIGAGAAGINAPRRAGGPAPGSGRRGRTRCGTSRTTRSRATAGP